MDVKRYRFVRVEALDVDVDEYANDIVSFVTDKLCEEYDIYGESNINSVMSTLMKDIIEKLLKKYMV